MHLLGLSTGCVLVAFCSAHDVYIGNTTIDCTSDDHACETSGTVMLGPGETLQITTHPDHDVEYVSMGHLEADREHTKYLPRLDGVNLNNSAHLVDSNCTLEFFSVVWFCNTHEDMTMARNATYGLSVPSDAQHSQFVAWGRAESTRLVLGWTVQYDAAHARHKVGFMHPNWALGMGSLVTVGAWGLMFWYYSRYDADNQKKASEEKNAWIVHYVAVVSHLWYVTLPLIRALSASSVKSKSMQVMWMYMTAEALGWFYIAMKICCATPEQNTDDDKKYLKHLWCTPWSGAGLACLTVILYVVVILVPGVFQLQIGFFSAYAAILLGVSVYFWWTSSSAWNIPRIKQLQCLVLLVTSLMIVALDNTNDMFFSFSAAQWAISICILQVLATQVGAIQVNHAPDGVKWSAIVISLWAMLVFDLTSYGVAALIMLRWVLGVSTKCLSNSSIQVHPSPSSRQTETY